MAPQVASRVSASNNARKSNSREWHAQPPLYFHIFALLLSGVAFGAASDEFNSLLDEEWEARLKNSPIFASSQGDRRYNRLWSDHSASAIEAYQDQSREFLRRTYAIDKAALSETDQLNFELFRRTLQRPRRCLSVQCVT